MRKVTGVVLATGLLLALAVGCGSPSKEAMVSKLKQETQTLQGQNYKSTAMMTVQTDNNSQTYYIQTYYEGPHEYRIALGDSHKNINQIIVQNQSGMFIVSPALQKVFRFNGSWAQNQGHIYLYDQILQQIIQSDNWKVTRQNGEYQFELPVTPANDVVKTEQVQINEKTMHPQKVVLYDGDNHAVVVIDFTSFQTGVKFQTTDFDPHQLAANPKLVNTAVASSQPFGYILPGETLGDNLQAVSAPEAQDDFLLRYSGMHGFALQEWRPSPGVDGLPAAHLVDLYGSPALWTASGHANQLVWLNDGVEFALTSSNLTLGQLQTIAMSTFGQVGK